MTTTTLTLRQLDIICYLCNGYSQAEIAVETNYSLTNIKEQIASARRRVGARSTIHLVSIVIASDVLEWRDEIGGRAVAEMDGRGDLVEIAS